MSYAIADGVTYTADTVVDGWSNWQNPKIEHMNVESGTVIVGAAAKPLVLHVWFYSSSCFQFL